jgi:serine/threonine protein kinase
MVESRKTHFGILDFWPEHSRPFERDFELSKRVLARGDLCEIRQCQDKRSNEVRTVKVYRKCEVDEKVMAQIKKEIEVLARLDHPAVTKVHAVY